MAMTSRSAVAGWRWCKWGDDREGVGEEAWARLLEDIFGIKGNHE